MSVLVFYGLLSSLSLSSAAADGATPAPEVAPAASPAVATKTETLLGGDLPANVAASLVYRSVTVNADRGSMLGLRADYIVDHAAFIGLAGYMTVSSPELRISNTDRHSLRFGYAGLDMGYIIASHRLVHLTARGLLGVGGVSHVSTTSNVTAGPSVVYIAEPSLELNVNVTEMIHASVGVGYRFSSGINLQKMAVNGLDGVNLDLVLEAAF